MKPCPLHERETRPDLINCSVAWFVKSMSEQEGTFFNAIISQWVIYSESETS